MTNKEYLLKYLNEHEDMLVDMISAVSCSYCERIGLRAYCRSTDDDSCSKTIESWLSMDYNSSNLKVGDIVEMEILPSITELRYYMGSELNLMYFCKTLEELEQAKKIGMVHYPNKGSLTLYDSRLLDRLPIRKVGEVND